ncbi:MAG: hypothetical protein ACI9UD_002040 [Glaciecola sp.]|jgi:hypothetical protein
MILYSVGKFFIVALLEFYSVKIRVLMVEKLIIPTIADGTNSTKGGSKIVVRVSNINSQSQNLICSHRDIYKQGNSDI